MAFLRERIARCQDELEAWRPDAPAEGLGEPELPGAATQLEELRQELKRKKFTYLAVEAQLRFLSGCQMHDFTAMETSLRGRSVEAARREAKERNQALKRDIAREGDEHARLYQELAEAYREALRWHEQCDSELHELARLAEEAADDDADDAFPLAMPDWDGPLRDTAEDAAQGIERAASALAQQPDELAKRRRLECERRSLEKQRRLPEEVQAELACMEAQLYAQAKELERRASAACELGLPRIQFVESRGVVILGDPPAEGCDDIELRTVKVEHDAQGRLLRAEPHPALRLWSEGSATVETGDLARLLTLVWDRICQHRGEGGNLAEQQPVLGGA